LYGAAANEASHDSGESYGRPPCHQDTRREYLAHLDAWSCATEYSKPLWMHGPAGTGKSAIAQSFCEQLHARGSLSGGFFFKRGHSSRSNAQKLFPTLAYQLATVCPKFKAALAPRVANDPALVEKSLSIQLQTLILEPYHDAAPHHQFVMVIDGLDECDGEELQQEIMRCVMYAHSFGLRFLVVSRPESHIQTAVPPTSFHKLVIEASFQEVRGYLVNEFERIRTTHEAMLAVNHPWPNYDLINTLVGKSSGHFIYPSTVIRFIGDKDWNPLERLNIVMGCGEPDADSDSPFAALDQLYIQILKAVPSQFRLQRILAIASAKKEMWSLDSFSVDNIAQILQMTPANIRLTLGRLRSVILLPETDSERKLFFWHHASFPDFLSNPERAGEFYFNDFARSSLAVSVFKAFCDSHCSQPSFGHVAERRKKS
ncbi:NACHT domain-containing protein, partial [Favolaschia claudopus]